MSKDNMFLNVWKKEYEPLVKTIEDNTAAYTKAKRQDDRDRLNEVIRDADERLTDLYDQFGEAYKLIFPDRPKEEPPNREPLVAAAGAHNGATNPNIFTATTAQPNGTPAEPAPADPGPVETLHTETTYTSQSVAPNRNLSEEEQYVLDVARKDQLNNLLSEIQQRYANTRKGDSAYEEIARDRQTLIAELTEVEKRLYQYEHAGRDNGGDAKEPSSDDQEESHTESDYSEDKKSGRGKRIFSVLLIILLAAALIGGGYILIDKYRQGELPVIEGNEDTPPQNEVSYWTEALDIAYPAGYTGTVRSDYANYNEWAADIGITNLFDEAEHRTINEHFYEPFINGRQPETVAQNTAKFFGALDLYFELANNYEDYAYLLNTGNNTLSAIYTDIGYNDRAGYVLATIVDQFDSVRSLCQQHNVVVARQWTLS